MRRSSYTCFSTAFLGCWLATLSSPLAAEHEGIQPVSQTDLERVKAESVYRMLSVLSHIRDDYVDSVDVRKVVSSSVDIIRDRSGLNKESWENCFRRQREITRYTEKDMEFIPSILAIECSGLFSEGGKYDIEYTIDEYITNVVKSVNYRDGLVDPDTMAPIPNHSPRLSISKKNGLIRFDNLNERARQAGIREGDILVSVNGTPTASLSTNEVITKFTNSLEDKITLTIKHGVESERDIILSGRAGTQSAKSEVSYTQIGSVFIIKIKSLPFGIVKEIRDNIKHNLTDDTLLILDLRGNTGGLFDQAIGIADMFLKKGPIVSQQGRKAKDIERYWARGDALLPKGPIIVLVDFETASGGEIIASALQDNGRAIIVGQQTAAAGTVQTLIPIDRNHGLKLTTAYQIRPNGKRLVEAPVVPDCPTALAGDDLMKFAVAMAQTGGKTCSGSMPTATSASENQASRPGLPPKLN